MPENEATRWDGMVFDQVLIIRGHGPRLGVMTFKMLLVRPFANGEFHLVTFRGQLALVVFCPHLADQ